MKTLLRIMLAILVLITIYSVSYWIPFLLIPNKFNYIRIGLSLTLALTGAYYVFNNIYNFGSNLKTHVLLGGLIIGSVTFGIGFFGPIILNPQANQGPLFGILISGPIGFIFGCAVGYFHYQYKINNSSNTK